MVAAKLYENLTVALRLQSTSTKLAVVGCLYKQLLVDIITIIIHCRSCVNACPILTGRCSRPCLDTALGSR